MAERNWAMITSGATFEALVETLVFFEDSGAALFGRPGKDGGQDVRSSDGKLVYQAKHHKSASAATAILDALAEAKKVEKYRKPDDARRGQWEVVDSWKLCTNAEFNTTDRERWDNEVVPAFAKLGLTATYWERANLDGLLVKHPEVDRAYFGGQNRTLVTMAEAREAFREEEPFLQRATDATFVRFSLGARAESTVERPKSPRYRITVLVGLMATRSRRWVG